MAQPTLTPYPIMPNAPVASTLAKTQSGAASPAVAKCPPAPVMSDWCFSFAKRVLDVVFASFILIITLPLTLFVAMVIKATSPGPVFFRQTRVGQNGRAFQLLKFRSMVNNCHGPHLTCRGDNRVTAVGRFLRKFKLDELPQFLNVLRGEMSVVGPRPHVPDLFRIDEERDAAILRLRPGITGSASLQFRREEDILQTIPWPNLRNYYLSAILPEKIQIELDYAKTATFLTDTGLVIKTASCVVLPFMASWKPPKSLDNALQDRDRAA